MKNVKVAGNYSKLIDIGIAPQMHIGVYSGANQNNVILQIAWGALCIVYDTMGTLVHTKIVESAGNNKI